MKRPDFISIFYYLNQTVGNQGFTNQILESRLSTLTTDNKLKIKHTNGKVSYFIKYQSSQTEPVQNDTFLENILLDAY